MKYNKIFKPIFIVLIALNLGTVLLLASNNISKKGIQEAGKYVDDADEDLIGEAKSILRQNDVEEVRIAADTDLGLITKASIAAKVGKEVIFTVEGTCAGDIMKVRGLNNYEVKLESKNYGKYSWLPERAGIFEMVLIDREGNERTTRQIQVASADREDIYELTPLRYKVDAQNNVSFNTSIANIPKGSKGNEALPTTEFTIGEGGIWTKTIKAYSTTAQDKESAKTSIIEGKDFLLDRGNYTVTAALKDLYSVQAEDTKSVNYEKKPVDGHKVVIKDIEVVTEKNSQGQNVEHFIVHAECEHDKNKEPEACDLIYAFSVDDTVGTKNIAGSINGYTESNELTIPNIQWTYTVTVKVKHKNNSEVERKDDGILLPNAYEATATKTVVKQGKEYEEIDIKNIKIQSCLLDDYYQDKNQALLPTQVIADKEQVGTMYVNSNNYITVNLADDEEPEKLQFKAFMIEDGQNVILEPVYESKEDKIGDTFVYYPKIGGRKSYNKNKSSTLCIVVAEINEDGSMVRKTTKNIEVSIK